MSTIITLRSGRDLKINLAPFGSGWRLYQTICREVRGVPLNLEGVDLSAIKLDLNAQVTPGNIPPQAVQIIKDLYCQIVASEPIEKCLWECFAKCLYNNERIQKDTFEPEEARADFTQIAKEVLIANVAPFLPSLDLSSLIAEPATKPGQT